MILLTISIVLLIALTLINIGAAVAFKQYGELDIVIFSGLLLLLFPPLGVLVQLMFLITMAELELV